METWDSVINSNEVDEAYFHFGTSFQFALDWTYSNVKSYAKQKKKGKIITHTREMSILKEKFQKNTSDDVITRLNHGHVTPNVAVHHGNIATRVNSCSIF
ncbi:hypothetical protein J6590_018615 [Homalodisca vitripennis]|nr:hypothetical protein J6590_018615 [Homalodisca vitripennis]